MSTPLRVLILENEPLDAELMLLQLRRAGYNPDWQVADSEATFLAQLNPNFDVILADYSLGSFDALRALRILRDRGWDIPFIIVTGAISEEVAVECMKQGAGDYLLKDRLTRLGQAVKQALEQKRLRDEKRQAYQDLERRVEERTAALLQAERLAAIGQMVTGLAHESRNALQRSQACLEMLALEVKDRPQAIDLLARIKKAQDHLFQLYNEVRGYAAPIVLQRRVCSVGEILQEAWDHLAAARSGRVTRLRADAGTLDLHCEVDRFSIEQVFRNILENSLSACGDPVEIEVTWSLLDLNGQAALQIALHDNGPGLTSEQKLKIFEPFYTTKTHGTGLGMAIVKRIVEAHGGCVAVGDSPQPGAELLVTLPRGNV